VAEAEVSSKVLMRRNGLRSLLQSTVRLINRSALYASRFGWRRGSVLALRDRPGSDRIMTLRWPGYAHPFRLRLNGSDLKTFVEVIADNQYELPIETEPKVIVDAGANIGLASVFFAVHYPCAQVLAIEPDSGNCDLFLENTKAYRNVRLTRAALWTRCGRVMLSGQGGSTSAFRVEDAGGTSQARGDSILTEVEAVDMVTLMSNHAADRVDVLKVDIEGSEAEVFRSSSTWIERVECIAIELHDRFTPGCSRAFYRATLGFPNEAVRDGSVFVWRSQPSKDDG
jgi:FkbM family methyltransferase